MLKNIAILIAAAVFLAPVIPARASDPEHSVSIECDIVPEKAAKIAAAGTFPRAGILHKIIRDDLGHAALASAQDQGADINGEHRGDTPLTMAVRMGLEGYVDMLIKRGAHINTPDAHGRTPLFLAAGGRQNKIAEWLLQEGANSNIADKDGTFPLYLAAAAGWNDLVELLLKYGAHVDARHSYADASALEIAELREQDKAREILLAAGAERPKFEQSPLMIVRHDLGLPVLRAALAGGADANRAFSDGRAVLHLAASAKRTDYIRELLRHNADPNARDSLGGTPLLLLIAANPESAEGARALINAGADANLTRHDGLSPLLLAVQMGRGDLVEALIAAPDSDPDVRHPETDKARAAAAACDLLKRRGESALRRGGDL